MDFRCFVSVELPENLKKAIFLVIDKLKATGADVKWVREENLHLTLKFLGDVKEGLIPKITEKLDSAVNGHAPFRVELKGAGAFPGMKRPRVIWLGIMGPENLVRLQAEIEASLEPLGFKPEGKRFEPHLTIGRVRSDRAIDALLKEISLLSGEGFGFFDVNSVYLMRSELSPKGSNYTALSEAPLPRPPAEAIDDRISAFKVK